MADLFRFTLLSGFPALVHGISDRTFGSVYPEGAGGRQRLAQALEISPEALVPTRQVHGDRVIVVTGTEDPQGGPGLGVDGLVTGRPGLFLQGYFADCVPILAYDPRRGAVGLAHAGWRGTLFKIATRLVERLTTVYGTDPADLVVGLGPSIGPCCYEVGPEVVAGVRERLPQPGRLLRSTRSGHAYFDLWEANRELLVRAGVRRQQIELAGLCTACHVERFFSYRREGGLNGLFGAVIGLRDGI